MEIQDTRFTRFILHFWIKYQKFRGASKYAAIFLNFLLLLFKLIFCGIIFLILLPHLVANTLRNKTALNILQKLLYVIFVIVSLLLDIPILFVGLVCIMSGIVLLKDGLIMPMLVFAIAGVFFSRISIKLIVSVFRKNNTAETEVDESEEEEEIIEGYESQDDIEELPFCQLFSLGPEMCLLIDHVEMCPDETAFIRVADEGGYTPIYKRKIRRDKEGNRYIVFNSTNYYLNKDKTQPIVTKK